MLIMLTTNKLWEIKTFLSHRGGGQSAGSTAAITLTRIILWLHLAKVAALLLKYLNFLKELLGFYS